MYSFDLKKIRQDFPILQQQIKAKPLVYLDNAASTQKPKSVIERLQHFIVVNTAMFIEVSIL